MMSESAMWHVPQLFSLYSTTGYTAGMKYIEIPPDVCRNVCGAADTIEPTVFRYLLRNFRISPDSISDLKELIERQWVYRQKVLPSFPKLEPGGSQEVDTCLSQIRAYQPAVVKALPASLYLLATYIVERGLEPPPIEKAILPMGGSLSPSMKRSIESAFQIPVHEDYGSAELGAIAAECGQKQGLHPFAGQFYIEVMCGDRPAPPGKLGRILITDLNNYAMPFIRYDIGDVGRLSDSPCPCGLSSPRLEIQGRWQDCILSREGAYVSQDRVVDTILADPNVFLFQLEVHPSNNVHLQLVPRTDYPPDSEELIQLLGPGWCISIRSVPYIKPEPGGKYRFVKNYAAAAQAL